MSNWWLAVAVPQLAVVMRQSSSVTLAGGPHDDPNRRYGSRDDGEDGGEHGNKVD